MAKYEGLVWRLSKNNSKLNKELYKDIMRRSPFIQEKFSMRDFKQAFHAKETKPEYRALLLSAVYDKSLFHRQLLHENPNLKLEKIGLTIYENKGIKFFNLISSSHGLRKNKITTVNLSSMMKESLRKFIPWSDSRRLLTRSLLSGSVHSQKVALCIEESSTFLHSLADLLAVNIRLNDPKKIYFAKDYPPNDFDDDTIDPLPGVGHLKRTQTKFLSHITHMRDQLLKYEPILNKIGIETNSLRENLSALKYSVGIFTETDFSSYDEETSRLYSYYGKAIDLLEDINDMATSLESINLTDPSTYKIGMNEVVPKYQPYSARDQKYVETNPKGFVSEAIRDIMGMFDDEY